jgi:hypothetical protein
MEFEMHGMRTGIGFIVLLTFAGCGGGSAGTRATTAPVPLVYPPLTAGGQANLTGQSVHLGVDAATSSSTQLNGSVDGRVEWVGEVPRVLNMEIAVPAVALSFSETFDNPSVRSLEIAPGVRVDVSTEEKIASDGSRRSVLLLHPASAGLRYVTLGAWGYAQPSSPTYYDGRFTLGTATRVRDIPVTGSASYTGLMLGTLFDAAGVHDVSAYATAQADFAARSVSLATDQSTRTLRGGAGAPVGDAGLNLSGVLTYAAGSNNLSGTLTSAANGLTGQSRARFYGPAVRELGGTYFIENPDGSQQMGGAFALKR